MERADHESDQLGHNYVGPEHVLVALAADQSSAGRALRGLGLDTEAIRAELIRLVEAGVLPGRYRDDAELLGSLGIDLEAVRDAVNDAFGATNVEETARQVARRGTGRTPPWSWPPSGKGMAARRALELAEAEADHQPVGPEHVLLGLLHDAQNPVKVARCFKLPRARQARTRRGWPQPDRPSPIAAMLQSRGKTTETLRQAILAQMAATT
jgi:ATP-dependent Clp protease ATP-binding subunit ClpA